MQVLQTAADHGSSAGAQQALNTLAGLRCGPMVSSRPERSLCLVFVLELVPAKTQCECKNPECRVDALHAVWQELLVDSGEYSDEQCELAYWAFRIAQSICHNESVQGFQVPAESDTALVARLMSKWSAEDSDEGEEEIIEISEDFGFDLRPDLEERI